MIIPPRVPKPTCLAEPDFERIVAGHVRAEDVYHLDRCGSCRAALIVERDEQTSIVAVEASRFRLAAATFQTSRTVNLQTADGSLSCDLDLDDTVMGVALVADHAVWGDYVALWPGPGDPYLLQIGARTTLPRHACYSLDHWRIGRDETETILHVFGTGTLIRSPNTALDIRQRDERLILNWNSPIHSMLAVETGVGQWEETELPVDIRHCLPVKARIYTPLSATALHQ